MMMVVKMVVPSNDDGSGEDGGSDDGGGEDGGT